MSDRINRTVICEGDCNDNPPIRRLGDPLQSDICDICWQVLSYNTPPNTKKQLISKKVNKVESISEINNNKELNIEVNKIYNEKCEATISRFPDNFVDYVFTSPPYNVSTGVDGEKYKGKDNYSDNLTQQQYFEWQAKLIKSLLRVTKNHIFYNNQILTTNKNALITLMEHMKDNLKEICIWNKKIVAPASTPGVMNSKFEIILIFSKNNPHERNFKDGNFHGTFSNVVELKGHQRNDYADVHKAVFPESLPRTFIKSFGKEGDIWYDPFGGTGTVAVTAIQEKRRWIISEMSNQYCKLASKRIKAKQKVITLDLI